MPSRLPLLRTTSLALLLSAPIAAQPARANDTVAHLGAGGLEFGTTDAIAMEREDLFVSRERIRVDYRFRNLTGEPVDLRVAFPLPRLDMRVVFGCSDVSIPHRDKPDFVGFETRVDGRPVPLERQERAYVGDREVTALLREVGLPVAPTDEGLPDALKRLAPETRERLKRAGALAEDACGDDGALGPAWTAEVIYHRQQRFAPGTVTRVEHAYTPSVGSFFITPPARLVGPSDRRTPEDDPSLARYCIDEGTWRAIRGQAKGREAIGQPVDYVLRTARSWRGPIGEFALTLDKGSPDALVSLCMSGVRKTGPTTFEARRRDFRPDDDLRVLFVIKGGG